MSFRIEKDSIGKIKVPSKAYYGAQTQRAVENFQIGWPMEFSLILPYIIIKKCAARTNYAQKNISKKLSNAIIKLFTHFDTSLLFLLFKTNGNDLFTSIGLDIFRNIEEPN